MADGEKRKELVLEGLSCGDCSLRIENGIAGLPGVTQAAVSFQDKTLSLEIADGADAEKILAASRKIIKDIEPEIIINEKGVDKTSRRIWLVMGLCCADCARRIGESVGAIEGVKRARIDFERGELHIDVADEEQAPRIRREAHRRARRVVKGARVVAGELRETRLRLVKRVAFFAGLPFFALGLSGLIPGAAPFLFAASYLFFGWDVLLRAARNLLRGRIFDENFLMTVATGGAFAVQAFPEAAAVMLFYKIGTLLEESAVERSRHSIKAALALKPESARLARDHGDRVISPDEAKVGDIIRVLPGEKIPLDARVTEGSSYVDSSLITGESEPALKGPGDAVYAGSVNRNGVLLARVEKTVDDSAVSRIIDFVEKANRKKSKAEHFIGAFTKWYTPLVTGAALLLAVLPPLLTGGDWSVWIYRALIFLVISCPCALVLSIPLTFGAGIGSLARAGILVKGGRFLEVLRRVGTVIFDKTGTLTENRLTVRAVEPAAPFTEAEVLRYAALAESYSAHPAALAIRTAAASADSPAEVSSYEELAGRGVRARADGAAVMAGREEWLAAEGVRIRDAATGQGGAGTIVGVAVDGRFAGRIVLAEKIKGNAARAVAGLKALGVRRTVMLSGDSEERARVVGKEIGIDEIHAPLLPEDKVARFDVIKAGTAAGERVLCVGDGVNDAPLLARADVGAAMGGLGRDAAIEAADLVVLDDDLGKLPLAVRLAAKTHRLVIQNIVLAFGVKALVLFLGAFGVATMWEAVFADVGVALLALANALRVMRPLKRTPNP